MNIKHISTGFKRTSLILTAFGLTLLGSGGLALATQNNNRDGMQEFQAILTPLNGTTTTGLATASVDANGMGHFHITAKNLINAPHAQHVHFGAEAMHECPATTADVNKDGVVDTTEGGPAYGPVQTSLTTSGDTSPSSTLAIDRYPTYAGGAVYDRNFQLTSEQAQQVRSGLSAVVIHGIDTVTPNGKYDGDLKSELDPSLPQEATAPAACGILHEVSASSTTVNNSSSNTTTNGASKNMAYAAMALGGIALLVALISLMRRPVIRQ
ncbi:hypothetical protein BH10PAT3_BH10PAT3_1870 [soil metagenome]